MHDFEARYPLQSSLFNISSKYRIFRLVLILQLNPLTGSHSISYGSSTFWPNYVCQSLIFLVRDHLFFDVYNGVTYTLQFEDL